MMTRNRSFIVLVILFALLMLVACHPRPQQQTIVERNAALGESSAKSNFLEARQINEIEEWKDSPNKIVNLYIFKPNGDLLVPPIQCLGVPTSSTESLEPNDGSPSCINADGTRNSSGCYDEFLVPVDGVDIRTNELTGRDGTFGDPVPYRQCMTVSGSYYDFSAIGGLPYLVTSDSFTFPDSTVKRDIETELKIKAAEQIMSAGGCVDFETLEEIDCQIELQSSETITS